MMQTRTFTQCPECGVPFTAKGMGRHRTTKHDVPATTPKAFQQQTAKLSLAERLARIERGEV